MEIGFIVLAWLGCSVFAAGAFFADLQGMYPEEGEFNERMRRYDAGAAWGLSLLGPMAVVVALFSTGFLKHGWRLPK